MWKYFRNLLLLIVLGLLYSGCNKENSEAGEIVEIYLLKEYSLVTNRCEIVTSSIVLKDSELISNDDIHSYLHAEHKMILKDDGMAKLESIHDGTPFCMTVDREIIYSGFFKPGISSSTCFHSVTIDPLPYLTNQISINLGYPSTPDDFPIDPDPRENSMLMETFKKQGKLK